MNSVVGDSKTKGCIMKGEKLSNNDVINKTERSESISGVEIKASKVNKGINSI